MSKASAMNSTIGFGLPEASAKSNEDGLRFPGHVPSSLSGRCRFLPIALWYLTSRESRSWSS